ncbi:MAG: transcriptional regulator [Oscillatoriales cyanobacterium CG2_30_44_21]|nr:MAG: transcriptional regulator [Oscillatoriales cyanobacterium CG2_30_44_21]
MKIVSATISPDKVVRIGRIDVLRVDGTTEQDIALQESIDDFEAMQEMARFVKKIRMRLGMSQTEFSQILNISSNTVSQWEQGKRYPKGTAKVLLKVIDKFPESTLAVLR